MRALDEDTRLSLLFIPLSTGPCVYVFYKAYVYSHPCVYTVESHNEIAHTEIAHSECL